MDNKTEYTISLKDMFTSGMHKADASTQQLEGHVLSLKSVVSQLGSVLGISFAVFKGFEFVKSGVEKVEELHQAEAQMTASLISTAGAAGLSKEALEENAVALAANAKFSRANIFEMQSLLLTFTAVKKKIFEDAEPAIMDLATKMGGDLKGASIQVGKALNDPIQGINALRRVGVSFTKDQREVIKHLVETGQMAKAQSLIIKELNTEFGGSAAAAANTDPYFRFNKLMGALKIQVGEVALSIGKKLMPYLEKFLMMIKNSLTWLTHHKQLLKDIAISLAVAASVMTALSVATKIQAWWTGLSTAAIIANTLATEGWEAAMIAVNIALLANPIGLIVVGVAALTFAFIELCNAINAAREAKEMFADAQLNVAQKQEQESLKKQYDSIKDIKDEAYRQQVTVIQEEAKLRGVIERAKKSLATDFSEENTNKQGNIIDVFTRRLQYLKSATPKDLFKDINKGKDGIKGKNGLDGTTGTDKVKGENHTIITINIDKLIEKFNITTSTFGESIGSIKEQVVKAMIEAVNDSQIVAGV